MDTKSVVIFFAIVVLGSIYFMVAMSQNELAPTEDQGILFYQGLGPQTSTLDYLQEHGDEVQERMSTVPGYHEDFMILGITGPNAVFGGFKMKPWSERDISQFEVQPQLDQELKNVTACRPPFSPDLPFRVPVAACHSSL